MRKKQTAAVLAGLFLLCAAFFAVLQAGSDKAAQPLPVLMYHHFCPDGEPCNEMTVTASRLEEDLQWLEDNGYTTVLPRELAAGDPLPEKPVLITFDDGYRSNYELAYPLLQKYRAKAVISLMTYMQDSCAGEFLSWDMCREMEASGLVEIGSHTYRCHNLDGRGGVYERDGFNGIQRRPEESGAEFQSRVLDDIQKSYDLLTENLGHAPVFFAYPYGLEEPSAEGLIRELFSVTVTTRPKMADLAQEDWYSLPRFTISMNNSLEELLQPPLSTRLKRGLKTILRTGAH